MMRQRQAAVPWLSRAPSPAASSAAMSCPSSVSSSGATAEYTPAWTRCSLPELQRAVDRRAAHAGRQQLRPGHDARLLGRERANCSGLAFGFRALIRDSSGMPPSSAPPPCRNNAHLQQLCG